MRIASLILLLPALAGAQSFEFELQPDAFPVEISSWQPYSPWAGGVDNSTPEFCDIDGDVDLDFFMGDEPGYVKFWRNDGNSLQASFVFVDDYFDSLHAPSGTYGRADAVFSDMDGDGDYDAFVGSGKVLYYRNDGTPLQPDFSALPDTIYNTASFYVIGNQIEISDIDADGDYDFFGGNYWGYLKYYENIGTADSFSFALRDTNWFNTYINSGYADPCFGDLDADGDLDLLVGTGAGTLYFYRNDGTAQNANMVLVSNNYLGLDVGEDASPELADIDGDGDLDLFVGRDPGGFGSNLGDVYFYENMGTPQNPNFQFVTTNYMTCDIGYFSMPRLVDIDGDSDPDLFTSTGVNIAFFRNQGALQNPQFVLETENFGGITVYSALVPWFSDLDADGDYDLLIGPGTIPGPPGLQLYQNRGTAQIPDFILYSNDLVPGVFNQGSVVLSPTTADIDADGDQDLFVSDDNADFYFFENTGTPQQFQFQYRTNNWQNMADSVYSGHRYPCFYDIDDDGDLDLFIDRETYYNTPWDKNLMFYRNIGTPQSAQMVLENEDFFPELMIWQSAPFLLDMDQDGDGDMFVGDQWGGIRYFKNVMGDTTQVAPPPVQQHPRAGLQISLGPNPANPLTVVSCQLPVASNISLEIFDISGRKLIELTSGFHLPGEYRYVWDAGGKAAGMYFVRLRAGEERVTEKVVMLK